MFTKLFTAIIFLCLPMWGQLKIGYLIRGDVPFSSALSQENIAPVLEEYFAGVVALEMRLPVIPDKRDEVLVVLYKDFASLPEPWSRYCTQGSNKEKIGCVLKGTKNPHIHNYVFISFSGLQAGLSSFHRSAEGENLTAAMAWATVHEIGHVLGLGHEDGTVMCPDMPINLAGSFSAKQKKLVAENLREMLPSVTLASVATLR